MKKIPVGDKFAFVDDEDFELLNSYSWWLHDGYARSNTYGSYVRMHNLLKKCSKGLELDHINGNRLDNRKSNLRECTRSQNCQNRIARPNTSSQYKGVSLVRKLGKWKAEICPPNNNRRNLYLGLFTDEETAARAYDQKAVELFGEFAKLNF